MLRATHAQDRDHPRLRRRPALRRQGQYDFRPAARTAGSFPAHRSAGTGGYPATAFMVGDTRMCSCLEKAGVKVGTVEHLMSAFAGLASTTSGRSGCTGSAHPRWLGFAFRLPDSVGRQRSRMPPRSSFASPRSVEVRDGDKWGALRALATAGQLTFSDQFQSSGDRQVGAEV